MVGKSQQEKQEAGWSHCIYTQKTNSEQEVGAQDIKSQGQL